MLSIKRFAYWVFVAAFSLVIYAYFKIPQSNWLVYSAMLLSLISIDMPLSRRTLMLLLVPVASVSAALTGFLLPGGVVVLMGCLALLTGLCLLMEIQHEEYAYPFFVVNFLTILMIYGKGIGLVYATSLMNVFAGAFVAMICQLILLPGFSRDQRARWRFLSLRYLNDLSMDLFNCFLSVDYPENQYVYERRLHVKKRKFLQALAQLKQYHRKPHSRDFTRQYEQAYEALLDCAQARGRVSDYTLFSLCTNEMQNIMLSIEKCFRQLMFSRKVERDSFASLSTQINSLEDNYHAVLNVTAREPLVILLLLNALRNFQQALTQLSEPA